MQTPKGELTIQTLAMPLNTNANGDIFGGWIVSQMDLAAGVLAKRISHGRVATVAINSMTFLKPVHVGDVVSCHVELVKVGNTSMTIRVEVWAYSSIKMEKYQVTEGIFVFVAIDENGKPRQVPKTQ
ncbi:TPA: acyl-CoA thioesterase [Legionella pneumophila]|uniref:Acyl-CoA thioester hydrolase n=4 Tax=Legionella pneumophila TaxID=446 RepID=Q5ZRP7_LEGPH|nr:MULTISPECIES: acyl-CoA thioesterase [Legionella]ERH41904.1 acyl-CoA thioester hydrolase [Legionella pneumophila str. Leg01/53]ERH46046.1 acyl-CoA thioester hydrolase [Legionella pneumophila str. Leg01/11]ERI49368.1 acyl-CoA thioester hydrolase [Legionella pneumophila str. Leg01/20]AAU28881.1 acyl-CoA thioester hydrolase [Legionella pneumophila subsp. pneumophila str. Philadelphia 1]ABQ57004.1 acyl-CoA thioester hydrolase [Legionella pneumophila str. Corby]